jgi:hypothetical protein
MSYSDFDLTKLRKTFSLRQDRKALFENAEPVEMNQWLKDTLHKSMQLVIDTEKARSELIVMPVLLASREINKNCFSIYSGEKFDVDPEKGLTGECDFILTFTPPLQAIQAPIITIVEAKKNDIDGSLGQCGAQMLAARLFNKYDNQNIEIIFGCVTTGEAWQFLKIENDIIIIDSNRYYIDNIGKILGIIKTIITFYNTLIPGQMS